MPEILVFSAFLPKLTGSRVVLDLHDPMPEVFMAKYGLPESHPMIQLLKKLENLSVDFACLVLTPNLAFRNLFVARGCPIDKIHIIMNSPDTNYFRSSDRKGSCGCQNNRESFVVMYHGTIVERHGLGIALKAINILRYRIPNLSFRVYGEGDFTDGFLSQIHALALQDVVTYFGHMPHDQIPSLIEDVDLGVVPNRKTLFTEINLPTRIFEYLVMGRPVVVPRTLGILDYFDDSAVYFFSPDNVEDLARTIYRAYSHPRERLRMVTAGQAVCNEHGWEKQKKAYLGLLNLLPS